MLVVFLHASGGAICNVCMLAAAALNLGGLGTVLTCYACHSDRMALCKAPRSSLQRMSEAVASERRLPCLGIQQSTSEVLGFSLWLRPGSQYDAALMQCDAT